MTTTFSPGDDVINSLDIISRFEELKSECQYLTDAIEEAQNKYKEASGDEDLNAYNQDINDAENALTDWAKSEEGQEFKALQSLVNKADSVPDWTYGELLIHESYFVEYTEQLIDDGYDMQIPRSGEWPFRHVTIDYEAAAEELKADYIDVMFAGETYYIRSC